MGRRSGGERIRLALCGLTALADDVVSVLVRDVEDIEIVVRLPDSPDVLGAFERSGADILIYAVAEDTMDERWREALRERPPVMVLNLGPDAVRGRLFALHEAQTPVGELTADSLLRVLRRRLELTCRTDRVHDG